MGRPRLLVRAAAPPTSIGAEPACRSGRRAPRIVPGAAGGRLGGRDLCGDLGSRFGSDCCSRLRRGCLGSYFRARLGRDFGRHSRSSFFRGRRARGRSGCRRRRVRPAVGSAREVEPARGLAPTRSVERTTANALKSRPGHR